MTTALARTLRRDITLSDNEIQALGQGHAVIRDHVLGQDMARQIAVDVQVFAGELQPARMGHGAARWLDVTERGDELMWIDPATAPASLHCLRDRLEALRLHLNRDAYLGLRRFDLQLAQYRLHGARYARHADAFRVQTRRRLTAIYYVNPRWIPAHGGVLRLYTPDGPRDVEPLLDRMVLFLSEQVEHEVLPSFALRTALTAWFYGDMG